MGGPGSGRKPEKAIAPKDLAWLYDGLAERLMRGELGAQTELLLRAEQLRLKNKISSKQHQDVVNSARVRGAMGNHLSKEWRTKALLELEARVKTLEADNSKLRDVGPPNDSLARKSKK